MLNALFWRQVVISYFEIPSGTLFGISLYIRQKSTFEFKCLVAVYNKELAAFVNVQGVGPLPWPLNLKPHAIFQWGMDPLVPSPSKSIDKLTFIKSIKIENIHTKSDQLLSPFHKFDF